MTAPSLIARQLRTAGRAFRSWLKVWASSPLLHACRLSTGAATAGIASMVVIGTTGAMLGVSPSLAQEKHRADFVTGSVDDSVLTQALDALRRNGSVTPRSLTVRNGETLSSLLARLEVVDPQAVSYIRSQRMLRPLVMPQDGQYVNAGVLPDGRLAFLHLYLEGPHPQDSRRIEVTRTGELFAAAEYPVAFDTLEESISGVASSGFAATVESLRIPADIAEQLKVVWEGADNPVRTLKQGDSLRLVFERKFAGGDFIRNGQLLAVQVVSGEDVHEAALRELRAETGVTPISNDRMRIDQVTDCYSSEGMTDELAHIMVIHLDGFQQGERHFDADEHVESAWVSWPDLLATHITASNSIIAIQHEQIRRLTAGK